VKLRTNKTVSCGADVYTPTFLLFDQSSVILALIVLLMLESWVPGHLSRVAPKNEQKKQCKNYYSRLESGNTKRHTKRIT